MRYTVILTDEAKARLHALPLTLRRDIGHKLFLLERPGREREIFCVWNPEDRYSAVGGVSATHAQEFLASATALLPLI